MADRGNLQINVGLMTVDSMHSRSILYSGKGSEKHAEKSALMFNT
jgi:hypothetical protein